MAIRRHIALDSDVLDGKAFVRGTQIPVEQILRELSQGRTAELIAVDFPELSPEDIGDCIAYGARVMEEIREYVLPDESGLPLDTETLDTTPTWAARVTINPEVCFGKPVICGTRIAVEFIIELLAEGMSQDEILANYPSLGDEDIVASLAYARDTLRATRKNPLAHK